MFSDKNCDLFIKAVIQYLNGFLHPVIIHLQKLLARHNIKSSKVVKNASLLASSRSELLLKLENSFKEVKDSIITLQVNDNQLNKNLTTLGREICKQLLHIIDSHFKNIILLWRLYLKLVNSVN